ncbi:reverse transcriptase domain-containing protein [Tanacetum coccineum]
MNQHPVYQATPQIQGVSKTDFENYVKANDAVLKNVQNQGQYLQNQMANVTSLLTSLCDNFKNSTSASNSGTLPSQTVTNPREHVNVITTRSDPEQNSKTSTEKVQNPNLENTAHVPSSEEEESIFIEIPKPKAKKTVNVEIQDLNSPRPNSYQSKLPYPERMKVRENDKPNAQHSRFLKIFKLLCLEIGLKDALVEMPKFNKWLNSLLRNKEKLEEIAITTVNAECSAIIMNKVPEKLEDPGKFLIPCALQELNRTSALADSGASINLLPHSIYKKLRLEALTPTRMTLELANRSITHPMGIAEDVVVRVDGFTFLAYFVVVNFEPDPRVPIILGRPFLRTAKALIDLYEETLTLRVGKEELVYYADKSEKNKDKNFVHAISDLHEENFQVYSNPLFEFDDNFKSSNVNPLFEENDKDVEIKSSSSFILTSPEESEFEADSIPPGIDLTLPPTLEVSSSNPTSPTLTGEKQLTYIKPKPLSRPQEVEEIKEKEDEVSSDVPIHTIVMPIRITFDNPIDFNDHFSKPKDFKKDLTVSLDFIESSILPPPLLDSDSPFNAELSASVTLNSLRNEDKVFKPSILVYHAIHDKNLVTLEENLKENISSGTFLVFKEPSFLLPSPEPPDECLNFKPNLVIKKVVLNEDFYQSKKTLPLNVDDVNSFTFIIWIFLPYFTYTKESPLIFSFKSENFVFDPGIVTFHKPVCKSPARLCHARNHASLIIIPPDGVVKALALPDDGECREESPFQGTSTDMSKITRKPSKTGKHEHGKRKSTREAKDSKPKSEKVKLQSKKVKAIVNLGQQKSTHKRTKPQNVPNQSLNFPKGQISHLYAFISSLGKGITRGGGKEAQEKLGFALIALTKEAHMSLSRIATLRGKKARG